MASSIGRKRRDTASPSIKELLNGSPRSLIDALAVLAIGVSIGLFLVFSGEGREWTIEALGYGWVPAGLFVAVILGTLRYNPRILFARWRHWTVAAALTAMSIGALSTVFPSSGALEDVSLGGRWGGVLGGTPAILAALKIAGIAFVLSLVLSPKNAGRFYLRYAKKALFGFQLGLILLYIVGHQIARFLDRRYRILRYGMRRRSSPGALLKMLVLGPSNVTMRTWADREKHERDTDLGFDTISDGASDLMTSQGLADGPGSGGESEDEWGMPDSGLIPTFDSKAPVAGSVTMPSRASGSGKAGKGGWQIPSVELLSPPDPHHAPEAALQEMARLVETTLGDHGVRVEVTDVKAGPRILRFGLVPGWVTKKGATKI